MEKGRVSCQASGTGRCAQGYGRGQECPVACRALVFPPRCLVMEVPIRASRPCGQSVWLWLQHVSQTSLLGSVSVALPGLPLTSTLCGSGGSTCSSPGPWQVRQQVRRGLGGPGWT